MWRTAKRTWNDLMSPNLLLTSDTLHTFSSEASAAKKPGPGFDIETSNVSEQTQTEDLRSVSVNLITTRVCGSCLLPTLVFICSLSVAVTKSRSSRSSSCHQANRSHGRTNPGPLVHTSSHKTPAAGFVALRCRLVKNSLVYFLTVLLLPTCSTSCCSLVMWQAPSNPTRGRLNHITVMANGAAPRKHLHLVIYI